MHKQSRQRPYETRKQAMQKMMRKVRKQREKHERRRLACKKETKDITQETAQKDAEEESEGGAALKQVAKESEEQLEEKAPWMRLHEAIWKLRIQRGGLKRRLKLTMEMIYQFRCKMQRTQANKDAKEEMMAGKKEVNEEQKMLMENWEAELCKTKEERGKYWCKW